MHLSFGSSISQSWQYVCSSNISMWLIPVEWLACSDSQPDHFTFTPPWAVPMGHIWFFRRSRCLVLNCYSQWLVIDQSEWQSLNENIENNIWVNTNSSLLDFFPKELRMCSASPWAPWQWLGLCSGEPLRFRNLPASWRKITYSSLLDFFPVSEVGWIWFCQVSQGVCERSMTFEGIFWGTPEELSTMLKSRDCRTAMQTWKRRWRGWCNDRVPHETVWLRQCLKSWQSFKGMLGWNRLQKEVGSKFKPFVTIDRQFSREQNMRVPEEEKHMTDLWFTNGAASVSS